MIQRIQTVWLLAAAILSFLTFKLPFYSGTKLIDGVSTAARLDAGSNFFLLLITIIILVLALITIFYFKNRKLQLKLAIAGTISGILLLVLYFSLVKKFETGSLTLWCIFSLAIPVCFLLAARGIWKDEKLVKSLDRLR